MKREPTFEVMKSYDGKYYWCLKDSFGQVLLTGSIHTTKDKYIENIDKSKNSIKKSNFLQKQTRTGEFYIVQISFDCQILSRSELYSTKESMEIGMIAIKKCFPIAEIFDAS